MTEAERLMHDAHRRFQRAARGPKVTFAGFASDEEREAAKRKRDSAPHSIHPPGGSVKVKPPAKLTMSQAMQDHLCFAYYTIFCEHDKLRIEECRKCKRKGLVTR
jgi:hypothetical protein